jgi:hypothetical protein
MIRPGNSTSAGQPTFHSWLELSVLLASLTIVYCSIEKPSAPTWNTTLTVPVVGRHYDMAALIEEIDEPYLKVDSLGNPSFCFEEELDTITLVDRLRCDSTSDSFKETLGVMNLVSSESREALLQLADFYSGNPGDVPPCSATVEKDLDPFSSFSQVTASQAFVTLTFANRLGLDLALLQVKIIDMASQSTLHTELLSQGVGDGDSVSQSIVLTDKTFSNTLSFEMKGVSPGGEVLSFENKYLRVGFSVDSMRVTAGTAKVPSFELSDQDEVLLPTGSIIDSAEIRSGELSLHFDNLTNLRAIVEIDFPEIQQNGHNLSALSNLPPLSSSDLTLTLDEYSLKPDNGNAITAQVRVWSPGSGDALIDFGSTDSVTAQMSVSEMIFSQVSGVVESTRVAIDPIERELDIPPGFEAAHLTDAGLNLEIHNGVDLPADLSLVIAGDNGQNLSLHAQVEAGGPFGTSVTSVFEEELESLFNPVPHNFTVTGEIICGDGRSHGIVREEDFLFGIVKVSSPLQLLLDSCQVEIDADSDEVEDDVREMIEDQTNFARLVLKLENHLPLEGRVTLFFSRNQGDLFSNPDLVIGPVVAALGELNFDGTVRESGLFEDEIDLTYQDLQVFTGTPFYTAGAMDFPGTGGEAITVLATDFIKVTSYLELNVRSKKE